MQALRLNRPTVAVHFPHGEKGEAFVIPSGAVITYDAVIGPPQDPAEMVDVKHNGETVRMFVIDLLECGARIQGAGQ